MAIVNDYIEFLNDFYEWEEQNKLTPSQFSILLRIVHKANKSGWSEWVKISNLLLQTEVGIKNEKTFRNNRDRLIELGLLQYRKGISSQKHSEYKILIPTKDELDYKKNNDKGLHAETKVKSNADCNVTDVIKTNNKAKSSNHKYTDELNDSNKINKELESENPENIFIKIPLTNSEEYSITYELIEEYKTLYPNVDIEQEIRKIRAWALSNPQRRKTKRGILRFVNNWLSKSQDKGSNVYNNSRFDNGTFFRNVGGESNYGNPNYHEYPE